MMLAKLSHRLFKIVIGLSCLLFCSYLSLAADVHWQRISSEDGQLPNPGGSNQQTGALVADLNRDGAMDAVISHRVAGPALIWMRRVGEEWTRQVIEPEFLTVEAGGAAFDIDGDGDLDIVFGADAQDSQLWWWENPYPNFDGDGRWKRHIIKQDGANQHHDQIFADFKGTGRPQLVFWNQRAKTLFLAEIPTDPRNAGPWPLEVVFSGQAGEGVENAAQYAEGLEAFDVDGDGKLDLLAGNYWFKYQDGEFHPVRIGTIGGRIKAGHFRPGKVPQVVIAPGDGSGPLMFYECKGDPIKPQSWSGRDLLGRDMVHGHTLDIGDVDGDGNLDIFAAEMAKWTRGPGPDHPAATAWILYGDGKGGFRKTVLVEGHGWHEGRLADLDGDGDLDVLNKPYTWEAPRLDIWLNNGTGPRTRAGMELWTYRTELAKDLPGTLAMIRGLGFTNIETASFYGRTAGEFRKALDTAGLRCSSYITGYGRLQKEMDNVIQEAKALSASYVLTAGIPRKGLLTLEDAHRAAEAFNEFGAKLRAAGLSFGYHPHGFEFVPHDGRTLFDVLLDETSPELVTFEMDVFWLLHGGADPVRYLESYPHRFKLIHLKDMAKGSATGILTGRAPDETSVALGTGMVDWSRVLEAARKAGVREYYIEDESPAAPQQVPITIRYLEGFGL